MAEGIARHLIVSRYGHAADYVEVESAGTAGLQGNPAAVEAVGTLRERGIDISGHRARALNRDVVSGCDLVLLMEERHRQVLGLMTDADRAVLPARLLLRFAEAAQVALESSQEGMGPFDASRRLEHLLSVSASPGLDVPARRDVSRYEVPDPIGLPVAHYRMVADMMEGPIEVILEALLGDNG